MAAARASRYHLRSKGPPPIAPEDQPHNCNICLHPIDDSKDYIRCANRCAAYFHRSTCFERWCGRLCLCKGLLCDSHPDGRGIPPLNQTNNCPHCNGPAYPNLAETERRWRAVFASQWFQQYVSRYHSFDYQNDPETFNPRRLLLTNDYDYGPPPYDNSNALVTAWMQLLPISFLEARRRVTARYLRERQRPDDRVTGIALPPRLISYIWRTWYRDAVIPYFYFSNVYVDGGQVPPLNFNNPYFFDRLLYFYDVHDIAAGHPQHRLLPQYRPPFPNPPGDVYLRDCGFSRINHMIHSVPNTCKPWERFRRMWERPEDEWPDSW